MEAAMKRSLICFCFLMVLDRPGYTQTAKAAPAFYIVLNSLTKTCTVVDKTLSGNLIRQLESVSLASYMS
jgi:hypothetical protein